MRIVHVSDCFLPRMGGIEAQVSRLAERQALRGDRVVVLTTDPADPDNPLKTPYPVLRSVWKNPADAPIDPRAPKRFERFCDRWKPDIVHLHMGELTPVVQSLLIRLRRRNIPIIVSVHSVWNEHLTIPLYRSLAKILGLNDAPVLWAGVSEVVNDRLRSAFGLDKIGLVHNGIDGPVWQAPRREHAGLVAVAATRFAPRKRVGDLIEILRKVDDRTPGSLKVVLAGQGPGWQAVSDQVESRSMGDWISLPGRLTQAQIVDLYAGADIYLSPSVREASSLSGLEARAAGLAVLTRSQSGLAEQIIEGLEGASAETDEQMAEILLEWIGNPDQVAKIVKHNSSTLLANDWSRVLPEVDAAYRRAIGLTRS